METSRDSAGFSLTDRLYSITQEFKDAEWHVDRLLRTWQEIYDGEAYPADLRVLEATFRLLEQELKRVNEHYGTKP
jgi:hypothetical protein